MDTLFDLSALAEKLPKSHWDVRKRIRRWKDAHSISADITFAVEMLETALKQHSGKRKSQDFPKMALTQAAIMSYARSLERKSDHRGTISIKGDFSDEQKSFHVKLVELRDESLAHFGPAGYNSPWSEDMVMLIQSEITWQPAVFAKRKLFDKDFATKAADHMRQITPFVEREVEKRRNEFQSLFNTKVHEDDFADILESCKVSQIEAATRFAPLLRFPREGRSISTEQD